MGGLSQFTVNVGSVDRAGAGVVSSDAGELSHNTTSASGSDFLRDWMDRRDETFSALRRKIRPLQPNIPRAGVHRRAPHLDVSDLFAAVVGRQIERHPSPGTRKNAQGCACRARTRCARRVSFSLKI